MEDRLIFGMTLEEFDRRWDDYVRRTWWHMYAWIAGIVAVIGVVVLIATAC